MNDNPIIHGVQSAAIAVGRTFNGAAQFIRTGAMTFGARVSAGWQVFLNRTRIDYATAAGDPTRNSIVVAVVGWMGRTFPEAPVQITRGATMERIPRSATGPGAMLKLLARPNHYMSGVLMWMAVIVDLYVHGNAYLVKVRAPSGRVAELWYVPKRMMKPAWPSDGTVFISHYEYTVDGVVYKIREVDVIHFRDGIDPHNPRVGLSKLASLLREIYTDDEAANFSAQLLTNLGVPGVVIAPANTGTATGKTDPEAVKTSFMEKFGGDKRGEPLVLTAPTDVKVLSFSPDQMNLRELRRLPEERVSAVLGISAIVAGLGAGLDRSTFTNYGEALKAAYEGSVIPAQRLVAADLQVQLLPDFASEATIDADMLEVGFDIRFVRALAEAADAVWRRTADAATKGLLTRAAFKRVIGEPVDDFDDVYIIPNNYTVSDRVPTEGSSPSAASTPPALDDTVILPANGTEPPNGRTPANVGATTQ